MALEVRKTKQTTVFTIWPAVCNEVRNVGAFDDVVYVVSLITKLIRMARKNNKKKPL